MEAESPAPIGATPADPAAPVTAAAAPAAVVRPSRAGQLLAAAGVLALPLLAIAPVWFALTLGPLAPRGDDARAGTRAAAESFVVHVPLVIAAIALVAIIVIAVLRRRAVRSAAIAACLVLLSIVAGAVIAFAG